MSEQILNIITLWAPPVLLLLSIVNSVTKHYTKFNGILRIVMAVIERLSFLASQNSRSKLKVPGSNVQPDPTMEKMREYEKQFKEMARLKKTRRSKVAGRRKRG